MIHFVRGRNKLSASVVNCRVHSQMGRVLLINQDNLNLHVREHLSLMTKLIGAECWCFRWTSNVSTCRWMPNEHFGGCWPVDSWEWNHVALRTFFQRYIPIITSKFSVASNFGHVAVFIFRGWTKCPAWKPIHTKALFPIAIQAPQFCSWSLMWYTYVGKSEVGQVPRQK